MHNYHIAAYMRRPYAHYYKLYYYALDCNSFTRRKKNGRHGIRPWNNCEFARVKLFWLVFFPSPRFAFLDPNKNSWRYKNCFKALRSFFPQWYIFYTHNIYDLPSGHRRSTQRNAFTCGKYFQIHGKIKISTLVIHAIHTSIRRYILQRFWTIL